MARMLILYYSSYGHVETLAGAVAEGARGVDGTEVAVNRVPELVPQEVAERSGYKLDQPAPVLEDAGELAGYDAIVVGTPTRFGNMAAQMRNVWDRTGGLWMNAKLVGKVGSAFTCTATQHGGQETTLTSVHTTLLHHGMVIVGVPYSCPHLMNMDEITGGSPYGSGTLADTDGSRRPSENELAIARFQGEHVARIARRLHG